MISMFEPQHCNVELSVTNIVESSAIVLARCSSLLQGITDWCAKVLTLLDQSCGHGL